MTIICTHFIQDWKRTVIVLLPTRCKSTKKRWRWWLCLSNPVAKRSTKIKDQQIPTEINKVNESISPLKMLIFIPLPLWRRRKMHRTHLDSTDATWCNQFKLGDIPPFTRPPTSNIDSIPPSWSFFFTRYLELCLPCTIYRHQIDISLEWCTVMYSDVQWCTVMYSVHECTTTVHAASWVPCLRFRTWLSPLSRCAVPATSDMGSPTIAIWSHQSGLAASCALHFSAVICPSNIAQQGSGNWKTSFAVTLTTGWWKTMSFSMVTFCQNLTSRHHEKRCAQRQHSCWFQKSKALNLISGHRSKAHCQFGSSLSLWSRM